MQEPQEMRVQSLGSKDPLEEGMATLSSILPGEFHVEKPGGLQSMGSPKSQTQLKKLNTHAKY